jgi:hypothetical protein
VGDVAPPAAQQPPTQLTPAKANVDFAPLLEELDSALKSAIRRSLQDLIDKMGEKEVEGAENAGQSGMASTTTSSTNVQEGSVAPSSTTKTQKSDAEGSESNGGKYDASQKDGWAPAAATAAASVIEDEPGAEVSDGEESHSLISNSSSSSSSSDDDDDDGSSSSSSDDSSSHQESWVADDEPLFDTVNADVPAPSIAADDPRPQKQQHHHQEQPPPPSPSVLLGQLRELGFCHDANEKALRAVIDKLQLRWACPAASADPTTAAAAEAVTVKQVLREYVRRTEEDKDTDTDTEGAP